MESIKFEIKLDDVEKCKEILEQKIANALEICGGVTETNAALLVRTDTSNLKNSITHEVNEKEHYVRVGTAVEYGIYNEFGTGIYAEKGNSRGGWWVYVKDGHRKSGHPKRYTEQEARRVVRYLKEQGLDAHMTQGMKPQPFLRPAFKDHINDLKGIIEGELKG